MFDLKPGAAARVLEIYLLALVGGLATVAAMLLLQPVIDRTSVTRDAEVSLPFPPGADAMTPERTREPSAPAAPNVINPSPPDASDRDKFAVVLGSFLEVPLAEGLANSPAPAEAPAGSTAGAPAGSVEPGMTPEVPAAVIPSWLAEVVLLAQPVPMVSQSPAGVRRLGDDAKRSSRSVTGYPVRSRRSALPRRPAIAGTAQPLTRGSTGLGCPEGSDPRLSEPDATGAPALICNPYYRRVTVDAF